VRLRPGGFLPARLVTAGDGLGTTDGDADGEDKPPRVPDRPEETGLAGMVAGAGPGPAGPAWPAPAAAAEPPP